MQNIGIALGNPSLDLRGVNISEISFQHFYSSIIATPCSNNLKFWLACEGICKYDTNGNGVLNRALYNDFLRSYAPFKVSVKETTVHFIGYQLEHTDSSLSLTQLLRTAQEEIGNLLGSENCDMNFIFHLVINYMFIESCRPQSYVRASETKCYVTNKPAQPQYSLDHKQSQLTSHGYSLTATQSVEKSLKRPSETFFQKVHNRLIALQKERDVMLKKAKKEAFEKGKASDNVNWYDFSGCSKKYRQLPS